MAHTQLKLIHVTSPPPPWGSDRPMYVNLIPESGKLLLAKSGIQLKESEIHSLIPNMGR